MCIGGQHRYLELRCTRHCPKKIWNPTGTRFQLANQGSEQHFETKTKDFMLIVKEEQAVGFGDKNIKCFLSLSAQKHEN